MDYKNIQFCCYSSTQYLDINNYNSYMKEAWCTKNSIFFCIFHLNTLISITKNLIIGRTVYKKISILYGGHSDSKYY